MEPDSDSAAIIKTSVVAALGIPGTDVKHLALTFETLRRRLLVSTYRWYVTFDVVASLSGEGASDRQELASDIGASLTVPSFASSLSTGLGFPAIVENVQSAAITQAPSSLPTIRPTTQQPTTSPPTTTPSQLPTWHFPNPNNDGIPYREKNTVNETDSASILIGVLVGALVLAAWVAVFFARKASRAEKAPSAAVLAQERRGTISPLGLEEAAAATSYELIGISNAPFSAGATCANLMVSEEAAFGRGQGAAEDAEAGDRSAHTIPQSVIKLDPKPIARGAGGVVFKGRYLGQAVAAKQLFSAATGSGGDADFFREVAVLTQLSHPCVLNIFGVMRGSAGELFMVVDYCGGGNLETYHKRPEFGNDEFVRVMLELLGGVAYLHSKGVAHRDLKPENVRKSSPL